MTAVRKCTKAMLVLFDDATTDQRIIRGTKFLSKQLRIRFAFFLAITFQRSKYSTKMGALQLTNERYKFQRDSNVY